MIDDNQKSKNQYQGAQWVRADFHLHSPGAFSFKFPDGVNLDKDRDQIIDQFVRQLDSQDIRVAAITDYQGVRAEWFTPIQNAARQRGIVVYPGAELSIKQGKHGLHILAIFPYDADTGTVNMAIQALDAKPHEPLIGKDGKHRDIDLAKNIKDALPTLRDLTHALLISAHPGNDDGLFKSCRPGDAAEIIQSVQFDAIESFGESERRKVMSTGVLSQDFVNRIAGVEFSDCHALDEIGAKAHQDGTRRATYLKLSVRDDLRAVRLALHDPQILVRTGEKPTAGYTHFERLEVEGSGFLGGLNLVFSPELNVLVGGRGVGKSATLEIIRYVLNMVSYSPTEYRDSLVQYALGSGGKARLYVEQAVKPNVFRKYRFDRVWGEDTRVFELDPEREIFLAPADVLGDQEGPLYFGQREIYDVTRHESQRLRLLDEITGRQARSQIQQVQKLENQLRDNARSILEKRRKLREREEIEQSLKEIEHKIELYRRYGLVEKLREATTLTADEQRLTSAYQTVESAMVEWQESGDYWKNRWISVSQQLLAAESVQKNLLVKANQIIDELRDHLAEIFKQGENYLGDADQKLHVLFHQWQEARQPLDEEIRKVKQEIGTQSLDPDELIRLTTDQSRLEPLLRALDAIQRELGQLEDERKTLLSRLREARHQVWVVRNRQAQEITLRLGERATIKVEYKGQQNAFVERLANFFRGSGIDRKSLERIALAGPAVDGITIAEKVCEGQHTLESEFGVTPTKAQQICTFLTEDEGRLLDLQLLAPEDAVQVYLNLDGKSRPLEKLSDGQRATAMLLLLLVQEERLLIVDQPEDDLDNRFIYDDIVRILREQKGKRQLLAATHNPNIPVLGNAELILALEASANQAAVIIQGAIDRQEIQGFVRDVMEGGEDAFRRRAQKYGWF